MQTAESTCAPNLWNCRTVSAGGRWLERLPGVSLPLQHGPVKSCKPTHRLGENSDERGWRSSPDTRPEYCRAVLHQRTHRYWNACELFPTKLEIAVSNHKSPSESTDTKNGRHPAVHGVHPRVFFSLLPIDLIRRDAPIDRRGACSKSTRSCDTKESTLTRRKSPGSCKQTCLGGMIIAICHPQLVLDLRRACGFILNSKDTSLQGCTGCAGARPPLNVNVGPAGLRNKAMKAFVCKCSLTLATSPGVSLSSGLA